MERSQVFGRNFCHERKIRKRSKLFKILFDVDRQISMNFASAEIRTRTSSSNGVWCCALLPSIFLIYNCIYKVPPVYKLMTFLSLGQLFYSILFIIFIYVSCIVLRDTFSAGCSVSVLLTSLSVYFFTDYGMIVSLIFSMMTIYPYYFLLRTLLIKCPNTFTVGEAMIVSQSVVLFGIATVADIYRPDNEANNDMTFVKSYIYTALSTVGLIVTGLYLVKRRNFRTFCYIFILGATYALIVLHSKHGITCIPDFFKYIFMDTVRFTLFSFWLLLTALTVGIIRVRTAMGRKASTETRKSFHILGSLVFLTGIINDVHFMLLSAGIVLALIILIEALRLFAIEPFYTPLQSAFIIYSDEKDRGTFAMTPIYLYVGLACPLLLVPWQTGHELELLSGVLSIGVGDTAASWFGSKYGITKWSNSDRTVEGTVFNISSQVLVIYALRLFSVVTAPYCLLRTLVAATISALAEARLNQVDNLILPLVSMLAFSITKFMA